MKRCLGVLVSCLWLASATALPAAEEHAAEAPPALTVPAFYPGVESPGAGSPSRELGLVATDGPVWSQRECSEEVPGLCFCLPSTDDTCAPIDCDRDCGGGEPPAV